MQRQILGLSICFFSFADLNLTSTLRQSAITVQNLDNHGASFLHVVDLKMLNFCIIGLNYLFEKQSSQ